MSKTNIEWAQRVWNFLTGCRRISSGCRFCYMFILAARLRAMGQVKYRNGAQLTVHEHEIANPYTWKKPSLVFVNSMSDFFHEDVPDSVLLAAFKVMLENPQHIFMILTKRPERLMEITDKVVWAPNIWMGVSVENEKVLHRVDTLRKCPATVKWISAEPLIGPLTNLNVEGIDWVVVGGESGNNKNIRPIKEAWVDDIFRKCRERKIPFFFKQWGKKQFNPNPHDRTIDKNHPQHSKGGCQLHGVVYREFPALKNQILNPINKPIMINEQKPKGLKPAINLTKTLAIALANGETREHLINRISQERKMSLRVAKAFLSRAQKSLAKAPASIVANNGTPVILTEPKDKEEESQKNTEVKCDDAQIITINIPRDKNLRFHFEFKSE